MKYLFVAILSTFVIAKFSDKVTIENKKSEIKVSSSQKRSVDFPVGKTQIKIVKHEYMLYVYDSLGWYASYPVVFGIGGLGDKMMEGDNKTPEGNFKIVTKKIHNKWDRFMLISYPTPESYQKFKQRKEKGLIPSSAKIGGSIGIHGTWPNDDNLIDRYYNWTWGCISLKNVDVEELYGYIAVGTDVKIEQ